MGMQVSLHEELGRMVGGPGPLPERAQPARIEAVVQEFMSGGALVGYVRLQVMAERVEGLRERAALDLYVLDGFAGVERLVEELLRALRQARPNPEPDRVGGGYNVLTSGA